jgi:hypothetical protein
LALGSYLGLTFLLPGIALPFKDRLVLDRHHMTTARAFLNIIRGIQMNEMRYPEAPSS